jgi:hypothetical protein
MKRIVPIIFAGMLALIMLFSACEKVVYPPLELPESVSYSLDVQPIFDSKCVDCHGGSRNPDLRSGHSHEALVNGGYVNTADPASSKIMQKLYGSHNSRATDIQKQLILQWITEGAKDN